MIHTAKSFAALLNGRQYLDELTKDEEAIAKDNNLVICFGQSDDLLEFRGAIDDELNAYNGAEVYINKAEGVKGSPFDIMEDDDLYCRGIVFTLN